MNVIVAVAVEAGDTGWLTGLLLDFARGGAEWVLWLLVALSILSIGIMLERFMFYWARRINLPELEDGRHLLLADRRRSNRQLSLAVQRGYRLR